MCAMPANGTRVSTAPSADSSAAAIKAWRMGSSTRPIGPGSFGVCVLMAGEALRRRAGEQGGKPQARRMAAMKKTADARHVTENQN